MFLMASAYLAERKHMNDAQVKSLLRCAIGFAVATQMLLAQGILGTNLIVNGDAETGTAANAINSPVTSIPGWTRTGSVNVIPYDLSGLILLKNPAPQSHGFQYFVTYSTANGDNAVLTQDIDVSSAAALINNSTVKFTASAYLGTANGAGTAAPARMLVSFKNGSGQTFSSATVGPLGFPGSGLSLQQQVGIVPSGTTRITVTLTLDSYNPNAAAHGYGAADNLSLVLNQLSTSPGMVLGTNLIPNGDAEAGPGTASSSTAPYLPGWSSSNAASVATYGGSGWIGLTDPGPANRGVNLFCGGASGAASYQDIDVSAAMSLIDSSQVKYNVSAWVGGTYAIGPPALTYMFFDWSGKPLAATGQIGGTTNHPSPGMVEVAASGTLPAGTRRVHIALTFSSTNSMADNVAFVLSAPGGPPVVTPAGILSASAFGGFAAIAPGSWVEIYGTNLAASTTTWSGDDFKNGVAPTSLGGVSVSVGGKAAFLDYVSPGQVNALVASDTPSGAMPVVVTNANGVSEQFWLIVNPTQPGLLAPSTFQIGGKQYVAGILPDGTFALPQNAITGVASRPAKAGENGNFLWRWIWSGNRRLHGRQP